MWLCRFFLPFSGQTVPYDADALEFVAGYALGLGTVITPIAIAIQLAKLLAVFLLMKEESVTAGHSLRNFVIAKRTISTLQNLTKV